jgi:hypothetical protein
MKENDRLAAAGLGEMELDACGGDETMTNAANFGEIGLHSSTPLTARCRQPTDPDPLASDG